MRGKWGLIFLWGSWRFTWLKWVLGACTNGIRLEIAQRPVILCTKSTHTALGRQNLFVPQAIHKLFLLGLLQGSFSSSKGLWISWKKTPCKLLHAVQISLGSRAVCLGNSEVSRHVTAKAPFFSRDSKQSAAVIWRKQLV